MWQTLKFKIGGSTLSRRTGAVGAVRFSHVSGSDSKSPGEFDNRFDNMDKAMPKNPTDDTGDVMWQSFGEGYATRCEEEGFGGIYGRNEEVYATEGRRVIIHHENHPAEDYDNTQGTEVAEKEKARHQTKADS